MIVSALCCLVGSAVVVVQGQANGDETTSCSSCQMNNQRVFTEDEVKRSRLNIEMNKILDRLHREEPPDVTVSRADVPPVILQRMMNIGQDPTLDGNSAHDSQRGSAKEYFLLAEKPRNQIGGGSTTMRCLVPGGHMGACFDIELSATVFTYEITNAAILLHLVGDTHARSLVISELEHNPENPLDMITTFTTTVSLSNKVVKEGWVSVDITPLTQRWKDQISTKQRRQLQVYCEDCLDVSLVPVSLSHRLKPYVHILIAQPPTLHAERRRRHGDLCRPDLYDHCCLTRFYVNFTDIGWSRWILQPPGYFANYCTGSCRAVVKPREAPKRAQAVVDETHGKTVDKRFIPCCAPTDMAPLDMLFVVKNGDIRKQTLLNMIVEKCGC